MILWLDFETRSLCDLKAEGVYNYARDISTEVICMCYAFDDQDIATWRAGEDFPNAVRCHVGQIRAHNAAFERLIFAHVLGIHFEMEQFYCTATQARANCMPGTLGDLGRFAGLGMQKDYRGAQLIRWLSKPLSDGAFNEEPHLMQEMEAYCQQDVRVMREASQSMRPLSEEELYDYHVSERVNDKGVLIDKVVCDLAQRYAEAERLDIEDRARRLTGGEIQNVRSGKMREWVYTRVGESGRQLMAAEEGKITIDKAARGNLLALAEEDPAEVPPVVAEVIKCADDIWSSSVAKFKRMSTLSDVEDQRVRGSFVFAGGSATGRAASYGLQVHNFPRKCAVDPEGVRSAMRRGLDLVPTFGPTVSTVLKSMLRPSLIAQEGKTYVIADWSAIEGRVNPWLSHCAEGEKKLQLYRDGLDPYKVNASVMYRTSYDTVTSEQRQIGKIQELALGFLGGAGSLSAFTSVYGVQMDEEETRQAVQMWRKANPWAMYHGKQLEQAYHRAMRNPRREFKACRVTYMFDGLHLWYALPSGRILSYPFAKVVRGEVSYRKASWKPASGSEEWPRGNLWYGLAVENVTQAAAHDLLRYAMRELDDLYYDIVLHVHDEIVIEVEDDKAEQAIQDMTRIMTTPVAWAKGLPLDIELTTAKRYGK